MKKADASANGEKREAAGGWLPGDIKDSEDALIVKRRVAAGLKGIDLDLKKRPAVGVALSGGGIRSATFCLGLFQALAEKKLVRQVDYLSTVSGGGYFGSFLGRMFTREWAKGDFSEKKADFSEAGPAPCSHRQLAAKNFIHKITGITVAPAQEGQNKTAASLLSEQSEKTNGQKEPPPTTAAGRIEAALKDKTSPPLVWLRESGNYLTPYGSGDAVLSLGVYLRNWLAVLLLPLVAIFTLLVGFNTFRIELDTFSCIKSLEEYFRAAAGQQLWWTPALLIPAVLIIGWLLPLGMGYWLTQRYPAVWIGFAIVSAGCAALAKYWAEAASSLRLGLVLLAAATFLAIVFAVILQIIALWKGASANNWMRKKFSDHLALALIGTAASFAFAVLDGWGQSIYATVAYAGGWQQAWPAVSGVLGLTATAALVRTVLLQGGGKGKLKVPIQVLALVAGLVISIVLLTGLSVLNHGIAWRWELAGANSCASADVAQSPGGKIYAYWCHETNSVNLTAERLIHVEPAKQDATPAEFHGKKPDGHALAIVFAIGVILCLCGGQTIGFLNLSSCHTLYSARLIRAYLGASSMKRWENAADITEIDSDDNIAWSKYAPHDNGGPLHLVNCALNCTESIESGAESTTAKGLNLCVGPSGLSYGQHHALYKANPTAGQEVYLEPLSLGDWVGISGAAFTTGLGNVGGPGGTAFGTSLLCGLFNVRLGYWWNNTFAPGDAVNKTFPVQCYLLDEFAGSFHVLNRDHWYLSDGGHFENTAAYELIRRRVPFIIIADCGADPDGALDDLANLTRRVRVDFKAEINFLDQNQIDKIVGRPIADNPPHGIGTLEDLRLEKSFIGRPSPDRAASAIQSIQADDTGPLQGRRVKRYATLAEVTYDPQYLDEEEKKKKTLILIIKPGLIGDEPSDLINYQRQEPEFPQQTTLDQFFDEAQWESYRKLGEHAMGSLLADGSWLSKKLS